MGRIGKSVIVFVIFQIIMCAIAWIGGFDFDTRSPDVANGVIGSIIIGLFVVVVLSMLTDDKPKRKTDTYD